MSSAKAIPAQSTCATAELHKLKDWW